MKENNSFNDTLNKIECASEIGRKHMFQEGITVYTVNQMLDVYGKLQEELES